jgi:hypothetical protein
MSLLNLLVAVVPNLAKKATRTADQRNVLRIPIVTPAVKHGALIHGAAGPITATTPPERVSVFLGPGATFEGLADTLAPLYDAATASGGPAAPTLDELARALLAYNKDLLPTADWRNHRVGMRLILPIEIDPANGEWIVDADKIRAWAKPGVFDPAWEPRLRTPPAALVVPDAFKLDGDAAAVVAALSPLTPTVINGLGLTQRERALHNPFESVLSTYAVLRAIEQAMPGSAVGVALGALDSTTPKSTITPQQASLLAATRAGNAILRRFAALLAPPLLGVDQARLTKVRTLLDNALKQGPPGARTFVAHHELPETAGQRLRSGEAQATVGAAADPPGGVHRLVLGRDLAVGRNSLFPGRVPLAPFLVADVTRLNPGADPKTKILLKVLAADAPDLGLFDGVRTRGAGLLAGGIDRWAAPSADRLPAVLARFKADAPDEFDLFFALHGLDVEPDPAHAGRFRLRRFGADGSSTAGPLAFTPEWAARFRLPALVSVAYRRAQAVLAIEQLRAATIPFNAAVTPAVLARGLRPFPTTYPNPLDPDTAPSKALTKAVTDELNGTPAAPNGVLGRARIAGARSGDTLACALVDLTVTPASPPYAPFEDDETFNTASMTKVAPLYAAHELRFRIQELVNAAKLFGLPVAAANWQAPIVAAIRQAWPKIILRGFYPDLDVSYPQRFPDIDRIFEFPIGGTVKFRKGTATPADITAAGEFGTPTNKMSFFDWMTLMVLWSNNTAASMVINALRYPYINGALREGGFFNPRTKRGIWISGDYRGNDWLPLPPPLDYMALSPRGTHHYKSTSNFVGNTRQFARLLTLAATDKLFDANAATCSDMLTVMLKNYNPAVVPPLPPGVTSFIADAIHPPLAIDEVASKIGIGVLSPDVPGRVGVCDCVVLKRPHGATVLRSVAVVVGGYDRPPDFSVFLELAKKLDGRIAAAHP